MEGVFLFPLGGRVWGGSRVNIWTSEWKMARFDAFWVLFLQTAVI